MEGCMAVDTLEKLQSMQTLDETWDGFSAPQVYLSVVVLVAFIGGIGMFINLRKHRPLQKRETHKSGQDGTPIQPLVDHAIEGGPVDIREGTVAIGSEMIANAQDKTTLSPMCPVSVNYHFTRQCNYKCGFCFHTAKTSFVLPLDEAKRGLLMLKEAGMEKINFSGGEPFLKDRGRYLGELVQYCKIELKLPSVTIVSNGSMITEKWFKQFGEELDILAVSCDSFDPETNEKIGRQQGKKDHIQQLEKVRDWCESYKVAFKINSVINTYNKDEDMSSKIMMLNPCRWKVFQCLLIDGENAGPEALRDAASFVIKDEEFQHFLEMHKDVPCLVPESNEAMRYSYLILDEYMRFLDGGSKKPGGSILDVGVEAAINHSHFDERMFLKRGGKYVWSKGDMKLDW